MGKRVQTTLQGERVGLFTLDPGRTSGFTVSTPLLEGTTEEVFKRDPITKGQINCWDQNVTHEGLCETQGTIDILAEYQEAEGHWLKSGIPYENHVLCIEDFVLRGKLGGTERSGISPRSVTQGLLTGLALEGHKPKIYFQQPGDALAVTNDRLRNLGLWTRGDSSTPHAMDAVRHAVVWVRRAMA